MSANAHAHFSAPSTQDPLDPMFSDSPQSERSALEVEVAWGDTVLSITHLTPLRDYWVGSSEKRPDGLPVDFILPSEDIPHGAERLIAIHEGRPYVRLLETARGLFMDGDGTALTLDALGPPNAPLLGRQEIFLSGSVEVLLHIGALSFRLRRVELPKRPARALGFDLDALSYLGLTALSAGGLLASLAYFVPPLGLTDEAGINKSRRLALAQYLSAAAEREKKELVATDAGPKSDDGGRKGSGSPGESGAAGKPEAPKQRTRAAVKGPADNPDPHLARTRALAEMRETGMIGLLNATAGDPNAPTSPFGRDTSLGVDSMSAEGQMWGDTIGDALGSGLGISGIGEGGGIRGVGIGLHEVGSIGGGDGDLPGGFGTHHGRLQEGRASGVPRIRKGPTEVKGRIPPEIIQRIVRQNFGRFRLCFESGLRENPNLEGRVAVRFLIGRDGRVTSVANGGSDLPDSVVTSCVVSAFYGLSFPAPDSGTVEVTYPIMFSPG